MLNAFRCFSIRADLGNIILRFPLVLLLLNKDKQAQKMTLD